MHRERPMEAKAIAIFDDVLDMFEIPLRPIALTRNCALRSSGLNACCSAAASPHTLICDMCEVQARASAEPDYILVTSYKRDRPLDDNPKHDTANPVIAAARFSRTKRLARHAEQPVPDFGRATVARMSHVPQIVSAVHNRPAAQLIFADL